MIRVVIICDRCKREADFRAITVLTTEKRAAKNRWTIKAGEAGDLCPICSEEDRKASG